MTHSRDFFKMENDESAAMKMTVFGKPNFGDPTLFEKKHEVRVNSQKFSFWIFS